MKEWIPIPGTNKDTLIKVALGEFSIKGYKEVNITELAKKANMTTGAVYHHFGSKSKLYEVIRTDLEQRIIDRMEGAASLFEHPEDAMKAALITGLNFAAKMNICKMISEEIPYNSKDKLEEYFSSLNKNHGLPIDVILISSWRSILKGISNESISLEQAKDLIEWMFKKGN